MEQIGLHGIQCRVRIGTTSEERRSPQKIVIDAMLEGDFQKAARKDDLKAAVDYYKVEKAIRKEAEGRECCLIENLAFRLATIVLKQDKRIISAKITVHKKPALMHKTREVTMSFCLISAV